jgi:putative flavoprotein involved in K+ transport
VTQLHSFAYRRPSDIPAGDVLVVGGGNSAAQLALELASSHRVTLASPGPLWFLPEDILGISMYWWTLLTGILNAGADARISRYIRRRGDAIVGTELRGLISAGQVRLLPHRVVGGRGHTVELADGTSLPVTSVLWCTGFRPDTGWIDVEGALDPTGAPLHDDGASPVPGLHWMGLPWQTRLNSSIIDGVDRDARRTVRRIVTASAARAASGPSGPG